MFLVCSFLVSPYCYPVTGQILRVNLLIYCQHHVSAICNKHPEELESMSVSKHVIFLGMKSTAATARCCQYSLSAASTAYLLQAKLNTQPLLVEKRYTSVLKSIIGSNPFFKVEKLIDSICCWSSFPHSHLDPEVKDAPPDSRSYGDVCEVSPGKSFLKHRMTQYKYGRAISKHVPKNDAMFGHSRCVLSATRPASYFFNFPG